MALLELYCLILAAWLLWRFGIIKLIRLIFCQFVEIGTGRARRSITNKDELELADFIKDKSISMLRELSYREMHTLLDLAAHAHLQPGTGDTERLNAISPALRRYATDSFNCVVVGLYCCTLAGFIKLLFFIARELARAAMKSGISRFAKRFMGPITLMTLIISSFTLHMPRTDGCADAAYWVGSNWNLRK